MILHGIAADTPDDPPHRAEAAVLWLSYYCPHRAAIWYYLLHPRYEDHLVAFQAVNTNLRSSRPAEAVFYKHAPWLPRDDQILEIRPADGRLRYLYVFSNPNEFGVFDEGQVFERVHFCLSALAELGVNSVAINPIPIGDGPGPSTASYEESKQATVKAIQAWEESGEGQIDDIYIVDIRGAFGRLRF